MAASIEECIYAVLEADARLAVQVGSKISPSYRPGTTDLPCVVYEVMSLVGVSMLSETTQVTGDFTVTVYADSVLTSVNAGDAILEALDGTTGTLDSSDYSFKFTSASYDYEPSVDGYDFGTYSRVLTFAFMKDAGDL